MTDTPKSHHVSSLGAFSISLPVADLAASITFYEKLGFTAMGGAEDSWIIMVNGAATIGLFHGMFDKPMLTFNPGWAQDATELTEFTDIRQVRDAVGPDASTSSDTTADSESGPASFVVIDPDGNPVMIDQHR